MNALTMNVPLLLLSLWLGFSGCETLITGSRHQRHSDSVLRPSSDARRHDFMILHFGRVHHDAGKTGVDSREGYNYHQRPTSDFLDGANVAYLGRWELAANKLPVRLVDSMGRPRQGRLEVFYNKTWGTVCDHSITDMAAKVVCSQLSYGYLGHIIRGVHDAGTGPIWLDEVQCTGRETDLGQCSHRPWGYNDCNHQEDVSIACYLRTVAATPTSTDPMWFIAVIAIVFLVIVSVTWIYCRTSRREHAAVRMPETASAIVVLDDTAEKCKPGLDY